MLLWDFLLSTSFPLGSTFLLSGAVLVAQWGKESTYNAGDAGLIAGLGRSPGGGHGNPLQYSCLENSMDRGAWWATVHGVAKSQTGLSTHARPSRWVLKFYLHRSGGQIQSIVLIFASSTARRRFCLVDGMALVLAGDGQSPPYSLVLEPLKMSPLSSRLLWTCPQQVINVPILLDRPGVHSACLN